MKKHKKTCNFCGEMFYSKRIDAKTCSNTCRVYLHKLNKETVSENKRLISVISKENNVTELPVNVTDDKITFISDKNTNPENDFESDIYKSNLYKDWVEYKDKIDKLPYSVLSCYMCGKHIKVPKDVNRNYKKVVCNNCIAFYKANHLLKYDVINKEGLSVDEAYQKYHKI